MKLNYRIKKSPEFIFDYLANSTKYVSIHPLIRKMESRGAHQYLVFETLKWGFLHYSFTYPATIESDVTNTTVAMSATVMKVVKVEMVFKIKGYYGYSDIEETIHFDTLLPIKSILCKIFKAQHTQLFKNIEALVEQNNESFLEAHSRLVQTGTRTKATVLDINDSGKMVNFSPIVRLTLRLDDMDNKKVITPEAIVSLLKMPEIQAQINIAYLTDIPNLVAIV